MLGGEGVYKGCWEGEECIREVLGGGGVYKGSVRRERSV